MSVCFKDEDAIVEFMRKGGYQLVPPASFNKHYLIIGGHTGLVIGCTSDRMDVLMEEPNISFREVDLENCEVCNYRNDDE